MRFHSTPGITKKLRSQTRTLFQRTFKTPLDNLPTFANILLAGNPPLSSIAVTVEAVVFTPPHLNSLLARHRLPLEFNADHSITADGLPESLDLLAAALADWLDFYLVPTPKRFLLYADHDEYTTVFAPPRGMLTQLAKDLGLASIKEVTAYSRKL